MIKIILGPNLYNYLSRLTIPVEQIATQFKTTAIVYASSLMNNNEWKVEVDIKEKEQVHVIIKKCRQCVSALLPASDGILENQNSILSLPSSE